MTVLDGLLEARRIGVKGFDANQPRDDNGRWKIVGITDEQEVCDHCGKTGLKRVVRMKHDHGEEMCFGTRCASKALGYGESAASQTQVTKAARAAQAEADREAERARRAAIPDTDATKWFKDMKARVAAEEFALGHRMRSYAYNDSLDAALRKWFADRGRKPGTFPWDLPKKLAERETHEPVLSAFLDARG